MAARRGAFLFCGRARTALVARSVLQPDDFPGRFGPQAGAAAPARHGQRSHAGLSPAPQARKRGPARRTPEGERRSTLTDARERSSKRSSCLCPRSVTRPALAAQTARRAAKQFAAKGYKSNAASVGASCVVAAALIRACSARSRIAAGARRARARARRGIADRCSTRRVQICLRSRNPIALHSTRARAELAVQSAARRAARTTETQRA